WAQVLASHEIDGVDSWIINDTPVTVDGNGWVTTEQFCRVATSTTWVDGPPLFLGFDEWGNPMHGANPVQQTTRTVTPLIRLRVYDGTQTTLDADILSASAGAMSIGDCGRGLAWVAVRFEADHDIFGQIGAPTIRAVVRGKRLFDPRTGLTAWTDNAALCALDYLQGEHGLRCLPAEINTASIIAAANVCDEQVPIAGGSQARYTINGAIGSDVGLRDNLESLVDAMAGMAVWVQGRWRVMAGAYAPPLRTLTESDIQQVESLVAYTPRREIFNTINGTFIDSSTLWVERQYPQVTNPGYVTQDGGQVIERQIDQPLVIDPIRAQRLAKIEIERARQAVTVQLLCKWTAYDLAPGDHVALSLARYGWASKVFFVASRELSSEGVRYVMRETAPGVWAWAMGEATVGDLAPNTALPNPFIPPPPLTGLAAASGTSVSAQTRQTIASLLNRAGRVHHVFEAGSGQDLAAVAQRALAQARAVGGVVVAAGGDGTINTVAQAMLGSGLTFGVLPQGTFNYFSREHGIPADTAAAVQLLLDGEVRSVQAGRVNDRVFLVNASLGLYPALLENREEWKRQLGRSRIVAFWAGLLTLLREHRRQEFERRLAPPRSRWALAVWAFFAQRPQLYRWASRLGSLLLNKSSRGRGRFRSLPFAEGWTAARDLP
ncbi:MAG: hypothetical protein B7Z52_02020, partial [Burkholderiales bacterium 12-64-5]